MQDRKVTHIDVARRRREQKAQRTEQDKVDWEEQGRKWRMKGATEGKKIVDSVTGFTYFLYEQT